VQANKKLNQGRMIHGSAASFLRAGIKHTNPGWGVIIRIYNRANGR
jgi:hypothetical protein